LIGFFIASTYNMLTQIIFSIAYILLTRIFNKIKNYKKEMLKSLIGKDLKA